MNGLLTFKPHKEYGCEKARKTSVSDNTHHALYTVVAITVRLVLVLIHESVPNERMGSRQPVVGVVVMVMVRIVVLIVVMRRGVADIRGGGGGSRGGCGGCGGVKCHRAGPVM
uniref:Uncharacterized protein n=1 Tax=Anopheles atroparvus TaxID=41427 RepID=A0A182JEA4_ANOAO